MWRGTATASEHSEVRLRTILRPKPRLPPVTTTLRIMASQLAGRSNLQRRDESDRRGNLVCRQALVTDLQDLALDVRGLTLWTARVGLSLQHDVGDDQRARDGTSP